MTSFGVGDRFPSARDRKPGPGEYDPKNPEAYELVGKAGFAAGARPEMGRKPEKPKDASPPRQRKSMPNNDGRKFSWATQKIYELESALEQAKTRIKELKMQHAEEQKEFEEISARQHQLLEEYEAQQQQLQSAVSEAEGNIAALEGKGAELEEALANSEAQRAQAQQDYEKQIAELQARISQLEEELAEETAARKASQEEQARLQSVVEKLSGDVVDQAKVMAAAEQNLGAVKRQLEAATAHAAELEAEVAMLRHQVTEDSGQLAAKDELVSTLQAALNSSVRQFTEESSAKAKELEERDATIAMLNDKLTAKTVDLEHASTDVHQLNELLEKARQDFKERELELEFAISSKDARLAESTRTEDELKAEVKAKTAEADQAAEDLKAAHEQVTVLEAHYNDAAHNSDIAKELDETRSALVAAEARAARLEKELESKSAEASKLGSHVRSLKSKTKDLTSEIETKAADVERLAAEKAAALAAAEGPADREVDVDTPVDAIRAKGQGLDSGTSHDFIEELLRTRQEMVELKDKLAAEKARAAEIARALEGGDADAASEAATGGAEIAEHLAAAENKIEELTHELDRAVDMARSESDKAKALARTKLEEAADVAMAQLANARALVRAEQRDKAAALQKVAKLSAELERATSAGRQSSSKEVQAIQAELDDAYAVIEKTQAHAQELAGELEEIKATPPLPESEQVARLSAALRKSESEAAYNRHQAERAEAAMLEVQRLAEDNEVLCIRMQQLEVDLRELMNTTNLGHNNPKQKIQYHLRLKQELEEMRHECMVLLRERYQLEQCIRFLAVRSRAAAAGGDAEAADPHTRSNTEKIPVQPASLAKSHIMVTPMQKRAMAFAGRGKVAAEQGDAWPSKEEMQAAIHQTVHRTVNSIKDILDASVTRGAEGPVTPGPETPAHAAYSDEQRAANIEAQRQNLQEHYNNNGQHYADSDGSSPRVNGEQGDGLNLESRILSRINMICSPNSQSRVSKLVKNGGGDLAAAYRARSQAARSPLKHALADTDFLAQPRRSGSGAWK